MGDICKDELVCKPEATEDDSDLEQNVCNGEWCSLPDNAPQKKDILEVIEELKKTMEEQRKDIERICNNGWGTKESVYSICVSNTIHWSSSYDANMKYMFKDIIDYSKTGPSKIATLFAQIRFSGAGATDVYLESVKGVGLVIVKEQWRKNLLILEDKSYKKSLTICLDDKQKCSGKNSFVMTLRNMGLVWDNDNLPLDQALISYKIEQHCEKAFSPYGGLWIADSEKAAPVLRDVPGIYDETVAVWYIHKDDVFRVVAALNALYVKINEEEQSLFHRIINWGNGASVLVTVLTALLEVHPGISIALGVVMTLICSVTGGPSDIMKNIKKLCDAIESVGTATDGPGGKKYMEGRKIEFVQHHIITPESVVRDDNIDCQFHQISIHFPTVGWDGGEMVAAPGYVGKDLSDMCGAERTWFITPQADERGDDMACIDALNLQSIMDSFQSLDGVR